MEILEIQKKQQKVRRYIAALNTKGLKQTLNDSYILLSETKNELMKRRARENEYKK